MAMNANQNFALNALTVVNSMKSACQVKVDIERDASDALGDENSDHLVGQYKMTMR